MWHNQRSYWQYIFFFVGLFFTVTPPYAVAEGGDLIECEPTVFITEHEGIIKEENLNCGLYLGLVEYYDVANVYFDEKKVSFGQTIEFDTLPATVSFRAELTHATETVPTVEHFHGAQIIRHDVENERYVSDEHYGQSFMEFAEEVTFNEPGSYIFTALLEEELRQPEERSFYYMLFTVEGDVVATSTDPSEEEQEEETGDSSTDASNVLFIPGIMGSRLYEESDACAGSPGEQERWFTTNTCDQMRLTTDFLGQSQYDIYTRPDQTGIVDQTFLFFGLYRSFLQELEEWQDSGMIADYQAVPYDWRLRLDDILQTVRSGDRVQYQGAVGYQDSYLYEALENLVATSYSGDVTIVTHSNGGLLAKGFLYALEQNNDPLLAHIDNLVLVGVPQVGTPSSLVGMLHGDSIGPWGWVVSQKTSRVLLNNMPFGQHLLPQAQYFNDENITIETPVIQFEQGTATNAWREQFGASVTDQSSMRAFIYPESGRTIPDDSDLATPAVVADDMAGYVNSVQTILRNWQPIDGMQVHQVAGTGLWTPSGLTYFSKTVCEQKRLLMPWSCAEYGDEVGYRVEHVRDGDETVVAPSAVAMSENENVQRWWIDLNTYNELNPSRVHKDLLELPELSTFVQDLVNATTTEYQYLELMKPELDEDVRLVFQLHSPLDMQVIDETGARISSSTEDIVGGMYRRYGELQYISVPKAENLEVVLNGESAGSFTLEIEELHGHELVEQATFAAVPSGSSTVASVVIEDSVAGVALDVDYTGDGSVDTALQSEENTESVSEEPAEVEVTSARPEQINRGNDETREEVVAGRVAGVAVSDSDSEKQVYYQEMQRLLQEIEELLGVLETQV